MRGFVLSGLCAALVSGIVGELLTVVLLTGFFTGAVLALARE